MYPCAAGCRRACDYYNRCWTVDISISGPAPATLTSSPSGANGVAKTSRTMEAPNKRGQGDTPTGTYTVTLTGVSAGGYTWDGTEFTTTFTLDVP